MQRYGIVQGFMKGFRVFTLNDYGSNISLSVIPEIGNNLYSIRLDDKEMLCGPQTLQDLIEHSTEFGIPILFPPNRIKNATFLFDDKLYNFPKNSGEDHIHGELSKNSWEVSSFEIVEKSGASITSTFKVINHPSIYKYYPFNMEFNLTITLFEGKISMKGEIQNNEEIKMPFSLGLHPYFNIPLKMEDAYTMVIPVDKEWPIDADGFISGMPVETVLCKKLNTGIRISEIIARKGYSLFELKESSTVYSKCYIVNNQDRTKMIFHVDNKFPYIIMFRPLWNNGISLEPYTSLTDCFRLGSEYSKLLKSPIHLEPRGKFEFNFFISFELD